MANRHDLVMFACLDHFFSNGNAGSVVRGQGGFAPSSRQAMVE
jgi:hypothetical protein